MADDRWLPTEARVYLGTILGNRRPITDEVFSEEQLGAILQLSERALQDGRNAVGGAGYKDYRPNMGDPDYSSVKHTLGRFRADMTPEGIRVTDTYDFDPEYGDTRWESAKALKDVLPGAIKGDEMDLYQAALIAGEAFGPRGPRGSWGDEPGQGRPVDFTVPYGEKTQKRIIDALLRR